MLRILTLLTLLALITFSALLYAEPVNINSANASELAENLKGIGPKKAQAIVKFREANGPFYSAQELVKVKGIGVKTVEKNLQDIKLR